MIRASSIIRNCNYRYIHSIHRCLLNESKNGKTNDTEGASAGKAFEEALEEERRVFGESFEAGARVESMRHTNASKIIDKYYNGLCKDSKGTKVKKEKIVFDHSQSSQRKLASK